MLNNPKKVPILAKRFFMLKLYRSNLFIIIAFFCSCKLFAQNEQVFSQFYASSLYLNPALSGLEHKFAISGIHRSQWLGTNPIQTSALSLIIPYHDKGENAYHKGGFGANFYTSNNGTNGIVTTGFSINGAYNLHIAATTAQNLTFGLQLGLIQKQYNAIENARFGSNYDINSPDGYNPNAPKEPLIAGQPFSKIMPDVSAGLLYYYNAGRNIYAPGISFYFGSAFSHLNRPNESVLLNQKDNTKIMVKIHSGFEIHIAKMLNLSPNIIYIVQGQHNFVTTGANFTYLLPDHDEHIKPTRIAFGASHRFTTQGNAMVFQLGFGSKTYNLGFSYDYYLSDIKTALTLGGNAFEVSFKTTLHVGKKAKKSSKFHTPLM
jgi:type IX secretion system PorP/SprF family membrane protein